MKKRILTILLGNLIGIASAQTINKAVMAGGGSAISNFDISINATIGEPLIGPIMNELSITQGFWAGSLLVELMMPEEELGGIVVFPNPIENELNISTNSKPVFGLSIFSVDGRLVYRKKVASEQSQHQINTSTLAKGVYVLQVLVEGSSQEKLFKIIKK